MDMDDNDKVHDSIDYVILGDYSKLLEQLKSGLDPNFSEDGVSLLHYAVTHEQHAIAQLLIDWGANRDQEDFILGETPTELSHEIGDESMVASIRSKKAKH